jgi:hypothetical protein
MFAGVSAAIAKERIICDGVGKAIAAFVAGGTVRRQVR